MFEIIGPIAEFIMSGGEYRNDAPECDDIAHFIQNELGYLFPPAACNLMMQMDGENLDPNMLEELRIMMDVP